ncbi:MAG: hypothetical protein R3E39_19875 [Anaerolineae bacterium]
MPDDQFIPAKTLRDLNLQNGALSVLWFVQQHGPINFAALYEAVFVGEKYVEVDRSRAGTRPTKEESMTFALEMYLDQLHTAGWIEKQDAADDAEVFIALPERFEALRRVLELPSLQEMILMSRNGSFLVSPLFGKPDTGRFHPQVMVLMPHVKRLEAVYVSHIRRVAHALDVTCERIKDAYDSNSTVSKIWSAVFHAQVCIADCTGQDTNTFYAMGIAHTLGKPCILIAQSVDDIPVDLRSEQVIIYYDTPAGMEQFEQELEARLRTELNLKAQ